MQGYVDITDLSDDYRYKAGVENKEE